MSNSRRFVFDEKRYIIDAVNPANSGKAYCHEGDSEDERHLRELVLMVRLGEMLGKLIIDLRPTQRDPSGEEYHEERHAILLAIYGAIQASLSFDPATMAIQYTGGRLKLNKGTQDFTSLSLFYDDVECLLRDLYGDIGSEALDRVLRAVCRIVKELTKYLCPDLWKEHRDAEDFDWILGIGMPKSWGTSTTEWLCGMKAKASLFRRVREVKANPSIFSDYTREFAKLFAERWDCTKEHEWETEFLGMGTSEARRWTGISRPSSSIQRYWA
jgi:hypothetical protein